MPLHFVAKYYAEETALMQFSFTLLLRNPAEYCKSKSTCMNGFSLMWGDRPESFGHQARGREQGQRNEWE